MTTLKNGVTRLRAATAWARAVARAAARVAARAAARAARAKVAGAKAAWERARALGHWQRLRLGGPDAACFLFSARITAHLFCMPHDASLPHLGTREVVVLVAGIPACSVLTFSPSRLP